MQFFRVVSAIFKVVNIPTEISQIEFLQYIYDCNTWIPEGSPEFIREYSSNPNVKNFLYKCSTNLLSIILKKGTIRVELKEYYCYEDFNILQCFKCLSYGHTAKACKLQQLCKNCAGNHHYKECTNTESNRCANCLKLDDNSKNCKHRATAGRCPIRKERVEQIILSMAKL